MLLSILALVNFSLLYLLSTTVSLPLSLKSCHQNECNIGGAESHGPTPLRFQFNTSVSTPPNDTERTERRGRQGTVGDFPFSSSVHVQCHI